MCVCMHACVYGVVCVWENVLCMWSLCICLYGVWCDVFVQCGVCMHVRECGDACVMWCMYACVGGVVVWVYSCGGLM